MYIVQIEHPVKSYDEWKKVFDNDPLQRAQSGVRRYRITRPADNPNYVVGDLEFDSKRKADDFLLRLQGLWGSGTVNVIDNPRGRVLEVVESGEY